MAVLFIPVLAKVVMVWMLTAYGLQHEAPSCSQEPLLPMSGEASGL